MWRKKRVNYPKKKDKDPDKPKVRKDRVDRNEVKTQLKHWDDIDWENLLDE